MRFLFVYQDYSEQAQTLLDELDVRDVTVIVCRKGANAPTADEIALLVASSNAEAAACEINRKYRRSVAPYVDFCCEPKKFRIEDQQLRAWLVPPTAVASQWVAPRQAMTNASKQSVHLVIADGALDHADELASHRRRFVNLSADLLARYANREDLGPLREWKRRHQVDFAANGRVKFDYSVSAAGTKRSGSTEWHLKEGDNTSRESAARIYFERADIGGAIKVVVFYVGPHPKDGTYVALVDCDSG